MDIQEAIEEVNRLVAKKAELDEQLGSAARAGDLVTTLRVTKEISEVVKRVEEIANTI